MTTEPSVEIIGKEQNILELKQMIAAIAPKKVTVLLEEKAALERKWLRDLYTRKVDEESLSP